MKAMTCICCLVTALLSVGVHARPASLMEISPLDGAENEISFLGGVGHTHRFIARVPAAKSSEIETQLDASKIAKDSTKKSGNLNHAHHAGTHSIASERSAMVTPRSAPVAVTEQEVSSKSVAAGESVTDAPAPAVATRTLFVEPRKATKVQWPHSVALGKPHSGYLYHPVQLKASEKLSVRKHKNFATQETVEAIEQAVDAVHEKFADTPRLPIGNLSRKDGGRFRPHKSHQNGRDADIAYFQRIGHHPVHLKLTNSRTIDAPRTWTFLESMIQNGQLEIAFIDYRLQAKLYRYALEERGWSKEELRKVIAYPRGRGVKSTIIRHLRGHADHMHLRFYAPDSIGAVDELIARHGKKIVRPVPIYTRIRSGDSLWKLAKRHRTTVAKLRRWNGRKSTRVLRVGRRIIIGWRRPSLSELKGAG